MRITLTGYYGFRNLGDDLILLSLLQSLNPLERISRVNVLVREDTYSPQPEFHFPRVHYHPSRSLPGKLAKYRHFAETDLYLWGGGTCLYEPEDGDIRGMEIFARNVRLLRLLGKPYGFVGIGMGTLRSSRAQVLARRLLRHASVVTFRDPASMAIARGLTPPAVHERFKLCGDLFLLSDSRLRGLRSGEQSPGSKPVRSIGFSGHAALAGDRRAAAFYASLLDRLIEELGVEVRLIPMQLSREVDDNRFHERIVQSARTPGSYGIRTWDSIGSLIRLYESVDLVIGMRLHAVMLADVLGIAAIGIEHQAKVRFYLDAFQGAASRHSLPLMAPFDPEHVREAGQAFIRQKSRITAVLERLRADAEKNIRYLETFLA